MYVMCTKHGSKPFLNNPLLLLILASSHVLNLPSLEQGRWGTMPSSISYGTVSNLCPLASWGIFPSPPRTEAALSAGRKAPAREDRKSTRLNSSHLVISYAVFCLKKKKTEGANRRIDRC